MVSLLRAAVRDRLRPTLKSAAGVAVRYNAVVNGLVYSTTPSGGTLKATLDGASGEVETNTGLTVPFHVGIFKIDRLDLPIMPQRLDKIEWIDLKIRHGSSGSWFFQPALQTQSGLKATSVTHGGSTLSGFLTKCRLIQSSATTVTT